MVQCSASPTNMRISLNFITRIIGMVVLSYIGLSIGRAFSSPFPDATEVIATQLLGLAGAGLGLLTTPRWTIDLIVSGLRRLRNVSIAELSAVVFGALIGLIFGVLVSLPLAQLPSPFGQLSPILASILLAYLGATVFYSRRREIGELIRSSKPSALRFPQQLLANEAQPRSFVVDTSAIIDGRIASVAETGFIDGTLLVATFVLNELQQLADSADELRRGRGRRGLDILNDMQKQSRVPVDVVNVDVPSVAQVDDKLIVLARQYNCPIITNDHNLGRVAEL
ncbi:MAG TPA: PIN domain-containing protein, partial [Roseiflexaceae bacterium]|nr:PIN domain-containing protein [Roseiflexaceae bacterium]